MSSELFKFDMHVHTKYSHDGRLEPKEVVRLCKNRELDGVAVTDHDTIKGALETRKAAGDYEVIIGAEILTDHGEVIGYRLNEEIKSRRLDEVLDEIKSQGGCVAIPHPFERIRKTAVDKPKLQEIAGRVDYIEALNGRAFWLFNDKAKKFAAEKKITAIAGSDAHMAFEVGRCYTVLSDIEKIRVESTSKAPFILYPLYPLIRTKIYKMLGI
ncbi:MAG: PHP domain-containing protein [Candidatus Altiarchaeota archaeon]|nr:PHP domain-containing protein [Candidatus Altiarchaeota archaeon]